MTPTTRPATPVDEAFLWKMLGFAASMSDSDEDVARAKSDDELRGYVEGYGRDGDLGVVAESSGDRVGAAWLRLLVGAPHPAKLWTPEIPELAIATVPSARGAGVGSLLLDALVGAARGRYPAIVLSVREGNGAVHLYERHGFVFERRIVNRVGLGSLAMRLVLSG